MDDKQKAFKAYYITCNLLGNFRGFEYDEWAKEYEEMHTGTERVK